MPRRLLALLVLHADEVVPTERLVEGVWGDAPPPTAARTLQTYIFRLRKKGVAVRTERAGYVLAVGPEGVDAARFERMVAEGRAAMARSDAAAAAEFLTDALALWRGPAL